MNTSNPADPFVHPTATIIDSRCGHYTEVGRNWTVIESALGDYSYLSGADGIVIYTEIGKFCSIASHVVINPGDHPVKRVTQHHCTYRRRQYGFADTDDTEFFDWRRNRRCTIGHDVWMGTGAKIMAGIRVGTGAVVGAGSIVTRDVAPYQIVVGVPARPLKMRFPQHIVEKLLRTAWWDWDRATLEERFDDLCSIERFIEKYHP
jgi:phosphonate metabolism protein (transferase hexapeptide repeat family)